MGMNFSFIKLIDFNIYFEKKLEFVRFLGSKFFVWDVE